MVHMIVVDREFRLVFQNSLAIELVKKRVFLYSLRQFVRSANYVGEKYIVELLPRESKRLFLLMKNKLGVEEWSVRNVFYVSYLPTVFIILSL